MVRLLEIKDDDVSMERVNLDDYNSDDYKEYLSDEDMLDDPATAQAKATLEYRYPPAPSSSGSHDHCEAGRRGQGG